RSTDRAGAAKPLRIDLGNATCFAVLDEVGSRAIALHVGATAEVLQAKRRGQLLVYQLLERPTRSPLRDLTREQEISARVHPGLPGSGETLALVGPRQDRAIRRRVAITGRELVLISFRLPE